MKYLLVKSCLHSSLSIYSCACLIYMLCDILIYYRYQQDLHFIKNDEMKTVSYFVKSSRDSHWVVTV